MASNYTDDQYLTRKEIYEYCHGDGTWSSSGKQYGDRYATKNELLSLGATLRWDDNEDISNKYSNNQLVPFRDIIPDTIGYRITFGKTGQGSDGNYLYGQVNWKCDDQLGVFSYREGYFNWMLSGLGASGSSINTATNSEGKYIMYSRWASQDKHYLVEIIQDNTALNLSLNTVDLTGFRFYYNNTEYKLTGGSPSVWTSNVPSSSMSETSFSLANLAFSGALKGVIDGKTYRIAVNINHNVTSGYVSNTFFKSL